MHGLTQGVERSFSQSIVGLALEVSEGVDHCTEVIFSFGVWSWFRILVDGETLVSEQGLTNIGVLEVVQDPLSILGMNELEELGRLPKQITFVLVQNLLKILFSSFSKLLSFEVPLNAADQQWSWHFPKLIVGLIRPWRC